MKRMRMLAALAALGSFCGLAALYAAEDKKDDAKKADGDFVLKASACGLAEVNLSNLALTRSQDSAVREFAQHMINDHGKANRELIQMANQKQIPAAKTMDEKHQKAFEKLSKTDAKEFDRAYMEGMVKDHEEAVKLFGAQSQDGKDETLKSWAGKTLPTLKKHLEMARKLCEKDKSK